MQLDYIFEFLAWTVESGASNTKVIGSIPR